jgi:hypothetical protein
MQVPRLTRWEDKQILVDKVVMFHP